MTCSRIFPRFSTEPPYSSVRRLVAVWRELVEEVPVRRVDFHAVETGGKGVLRPAHELLDDVWHLLELQRAWRHEGANAASPSSFSMNASPEGAIGDGATGGMPSGCNEG